MDKINSPNILEMLKIAFDARNSNRTFNQVSTEFVELFNAHYRLLENLNEIKEVLNEHHLMKELDLIKEQLEMNMKRLLNIIAEIISRNIILYIVKSGDSVWKISRKFNSNVSEIYELNSLNNIFFLEEKKPILVPIKF